MSASSKATEIPSSPISEAEGIAAPVHEVPAAANEYNPRPPEAKLENDASPRKSPEKTPSSPQSPGTFTNNYYDDSSEGGSESEGDERDEETVSHAHNRLARTAMEMEGRSQQELIEMLEARAPEDWKYVQNLGEMKSTIMHVLSDRWDERLSTFFQALMEQFPEMYLAEDYLNHTILDRNQSGRSRDLFACFFTENYQVEAAELVKRHPNLLALLLSALKDSDIWTRILREIPSDTLLANDSKSGNTFLHSVIQKAYRPRERDSRRFLTLIKEITQVNPKTMRATNAMGLTPYLYNVFEAKKQLELKESFSKRLVVWLRDRQRGDKPEESLSKRQVALLHDRQRDEVVMKSTEETAYPDKAQNHSATRKKQISTLLLRQMYRHLDVGHVRDILEGDEEDEGGEFDLDLLELDSNNPSSSLSSRPLDIVIRRLKLRPYLRYVLIPQRSPKTLQIKKVFEHLCQSGVTRIMRLEVDEDITYPHGDDDIVKELERFQIEELDWRKTDMCSTILQRAAPKLRTVYLYSSGNNAVLRSWSAEDGLPALRKLEKIFVSVLPLVESMETVRNYITQFQGRVIDQLAKDRDWAVETHVTFIEPRTGHEVTTWSKTMAQPTGAVMNAQEETAEWSASLKVLDLLGLPWGDGDKSEGAKVAIIDGGVDVFALNNDDSVAAGVSFASYGSGTGYLQPYYVPSSGRGTQLASIILRFDPGTRLCIARVESDDIQTQQLAKALRWSIRQKVQIIVLGTPMNNYKRLNTGQDSATNELASVLRELETHEIPIFCPFDDSDNDARRGNWAIRHIGATRWDERMLSPGTFPADFNLSVKGLELANGVSADAAATAFAAGLATLVMAAHRECEGRWVSVPELWRIFDSFRHAEEDPRFVSVLWLLRIVEVAKKKEDRHWLLRTIFERCPRTI